MNRCEECGSWGVECGNERPVPDCGCARCLRARLAQANKVVAVAQEIDTYSDTGGPGYPEWDAKFAALHAALVAYRGGKS